MYNVLIDTPPTDCEVNGRKYRLNTDFRVVLKYMRLLNGDDSQEDKTLFALILFYGKDQLAESEDIPGMLSYIQEFINRGVEVKKRKSSEKLFDLLEDSGRVFAAFMQIYGLNLRKESIHWWVFYDLLEGLPKGTHLADVIEIRGKKIESWMKPGDKRDLMDIKSHYSLSKKSGDPMGDFFAALRGACK